VKIEYMWRKCYPKTSLRNSTVIEKKSVKMNGKESTIAKF